MGSMYSELIYTRCGDGIDIKKNQPIYGGVQGGFKVFSWSEGITEETADVSLLNEIAKSKESYSDPDFMDDAYLFMAPDCGENFLVNFHPIPFDESIKDVDYPHVRGNFINQVFIGKFDNIYPYETFGNKSIWNAKDKGERHYYKDKPEPLKTLLQEELRNGSGNITFGDIANFIKAGRQDVLKKALAFILSQFSDSIPKENRKFLVIKDENSKNLELWIAAIESAFSPKMASNLSFATRMDDFTRSNKYTVNQNNRYVPNSPEQKLRLRAMIVGVDERDKSNIATVRALPNSPYVVLDGKSKTLSINIDTSQSYYNFITSFDKEEKYNDFCRHFLQMINISVPSTTVFELFEAYYSYRKYYNNTSSIKDLLQSLSILDKYELVKTKDFETIYSSLKENFGDILNKDVDSAFVIYKWLETKAVIMNDNSVKAELHNRICDIYLKKIIQEPYSKETQSLKDKINSPSNMKTVAKKLSERNLNEFKSMPDKYPIENRIEYWKSFHNLLKDLLPYYKGSFPEIIKFVLLATIKDFYEAKEKPENIKDIKDIKDTFKECNKNQTLELLFSEIQNYKNEDKDTYIDFLIKVMVSLYPNYISSNDNLVRFYKEFKNNKIENYFYKVLNLKTKSIDFSEMKDFIMWITQRPDFKNYLSSVFEILDNRLGNNLSASERNIEDIATFIYEKNHSGNCNNSIHIYALSVINDKKKRKELKSIFKELKTHGFPSCEDDAYIAKLTQSIFTKKIFSNRIDTDSFDTIIGVISCSEKYSDALVATAFNNNEDVANIVRTAYRIKSDGKENTSKSYLEDSLAKEFNNRKKDNSKKFKKFEKDIEKKIQAMKNGEIVKYFNEIIN